MTNRRKFLTSCLLTMCMLIGLFPQAALPVTAETNPFTATSTHYNENMGDGITAFKSATPRGDGTVDISIGAYTTGEIVMQSAVKPTDIVLVLDTSGSMKEDAPSQIVTSYNESNGGKQSSSSSFTSTTYYGFKSTSTTYYIQIGDAYLPVSYASRDDNNYDYYTDGTNFYYPRMSNSSYTNQANKDYPVVQFYSQKTETVTMTRMEALKSAAKAFIETTAAKNAAIKDSSKLHRVAIIKYASNSFYDSSTGRASTSVPSLTEGNNSDSKGYNYTQVVKSFTAVTSETEASLKANIDSLSAGGATAIDYGMHLAATLLEETKDDEGRAKAVIALTDGEPTYQNDFDKDVANAALEFAYALSSTGDVPVYSISMSPDADASVLGSDNTNKFMHYLSSNYPNAQKMNAPGEGDISAGYYMTPDNDNGLESIFTGIMQSIGTPRIEMGDEAVLTDSISSYFTLTEGTNSITLKTLAKTKDGWEQQGTIDPAIKYTTSDNGQTIKVTGFNFDENYVSDTPRGQNNDFYGKALLIQMNVKPVNSVIDAGASVHGGMVPTNAGPAVLTDSKGVSIATIERPMITLPKVTYSYTIDSDPSTETEYASYYRLIGDTGLGVIDDYGMAAYDFSGWSTTDVSVTDQNTYSMPTANVEFMGNFAPKNYKVEYRFDGAIPAGAELPDTAIQSYPYGSEVTVEDDPAEIPGYTFSGWSTDGADVTGNTFTMPESDVVFYGRFTANTDTEYRVEYYLQGLDDPAEYTLDTKYSGTKTGTTGTTVYADLHSFDGFALNSDKSTDNGVVTGDGKLVLRMYYDRNEYEVTYSYIGRVPDNASPEEEKLPNYTEKYRFGEIVDVDDVIGTPTAAGYDFTGWFRTDIDTLSENYSVSEFEMPAHDVELRGYFTYQGDTDEEGKPVIPFTVSHYLENSDGEYELAEEPMTRTGIPDDEVKAVPRTFTTHILKADHPDAIPEGVLEEGETLALKLYYERRPYPVTYELQGGIQEIDGVNYANNVPVEPDVKYGDEVEVAPYMEVPSGYSFSGWTTSDVDITEGSKTFKMPAHGVKLVGHITRSYVGWREEHYLQKTDGSGYELDTASGTGEIDYSDFPGTEVTVNAGHYPGYTLNHAAICSAEDENPVQLENDAVTTTVLDDGSRVIRFYYDRIPHTVTYKFEGSVPSAVREHRDDYETPLTNIPFGKTMELKTVTESYDGYEFSGWATKDADIKADGTFDMPNHDVILTGSFDPRQSDYKVRHLLENLPGDTSGELYQGKYYTVPEDGVELHTEKKTGALAVAVPRDFTGFTHITSPDKLTGTVTGDGQLVIDIHYDRQKFNVYYQYFDDGKLPDNLPTIPTEYDMISVPVGTELRVENGMIIPGYEFDGWHTLSAKVSNNGESSVYTMPASDVVFFGRFNIDYTVKYDLNGGTGADGVDYSDKTVIGGSEISVNEAPTRSGYTFTGWNDGTADYAAGDKTTVNSDVTFTAQWSRNSLNGTTGSSTLNYTLTYNSNGGSSIPRETYPAGTLAELDKVPEKEGYIFDGWHSDTALTQDINEVTMTKNITVHADWIEDNGSAGNGHEVPGSLNGDDHFAYVVGYPDGTVRPDANIDRAEVTAIFFRLLKDEVRNANLADSNTFGDVNDGDWYNTAISTMTKLGIVNGRYADMFVPDAFITRAEFAAICARFDDSEYEAADEFTDIKGHWAEAEIREAAAHGWIRGYEDNTFKPDRFITRAEAMTMINRVLNRVPETADDLLDDMIKWPDNSNETEWYYIPVQEATNSHNYDKKNNIYEKWTSVTEVTDWVKYQ